MLPLLPALAVLNFNYDLIVSVLIVRMFTVKTICNQTLVPYENSFLATLQKFLKAVTDGFQREFP